MMAYTKADYDGAIAEYREAFRLANGVDCRISRAGQFIFMHDGAFGSVAPSVRMKRLRELTANLRARASEQTATQSETPDRNISIDWPGKIDGKWPTEST